MKINKAVKRDGKLSRRKKFKKLYSKEKKEEFAEKELKRRNLRKVRLQKEQELFNQD